jgi:hypothetical protein
MNRLSWVLLLVLLCEICAEQIAVHRCIRVRNPGDQQEAPPDSQGRGRFGLHWT